MPTRAIILHGMGRTPFSMNRLASCLRRAGIQTHLFAYCAAFEGVERCQLRLKMFIDVHAGDHPFILIGHSLGTVLIRSVLPQLRHQPKACYFLAPPSAAGLAAKLVKRNFFFRLLTGEMGQLLGDEVFMSALPVPTVPSYIYAGTAGPQGRLSPFKQEKNDGILSVSETTFPVTQVEYVKAFHSFIMNSPHVADHMLSTFEIHGIGQKTPSLSGQKSSNWIRIIALVLVLYVVALAGVYTFQRDLLYFPGQGYASPEVSHAPQALKELAIRTEDGLDLKGWYAPATSKPLTLVFFHGNGDSLRTAAFIAEPYIKAGYGFLLVEYRGYSGMPGSPTETGLYADARASLNALITSGVREEDVVLFGHSLGTGVATQMASEFHVRGLILLAPYLSIPKMAQIRFPIFPAEYLVKDRFENFRKILTLHTPLLISNGGKDAVVPSSQGAQLFALANEPKQYFFVLDGGHNDLFESEFLDVSLKWLQARAPTLSMNP